MINFHKDNKEKSENGLAKYATMGFQMLIVIILFAFLGQYLDKHFHTKDPFFTAGSTLLGVGIAIGQIIKQVTQK